MYKTVWSKSNSSVCQLSFFSSAGIKLLSMTGFKANDHFLITDDYLFKIYKADKVKISFVKSDGYTNKVSIEI